MEYILVIIAPSATTPTVVAAEITTQLSPVSSSHGHLMRKRGIAHVIESRNWHVPVAYNEPAANYALDHPTPLLCIGRILRRRSALSFIDGE